MAVADVLRAHPIRQQPCPRPSGRRVLAFLSHLQGAGACLKVQVTVPCREGKQSLHQAWAPFPRQAPSALARICCPGGVSQTSRAQLPLLPVAPPPAPGAAAGDAGRHRQPVPRSPLSPPGAFPRPPSSGRRRGPRPRPLGGRLPRSRDGRRPRPTSPACQAGPQQRRGFRFQVRPGSSCRVARRPRARV